MQETLPIKVVDDQDVRQRLLKAGIDLFAEKGYASTSVREIVALAGVTKPVLYYYFQSKQGLFSSILDYACELSRVSLEEALNITGSTLDRLTVLFANALQAARDNQNLVKVLYTLSFGLHRSVPDYDLQALEDQIFETIRTIYQDGLKNGEVVEADLELASLQVMALLDFSIGLELAYPHRGDPERPINMLKLAFSGLEKRESTQ